MGAIFANISGDASSWHARSRYTLIGGWTRHAEGIAVSQKCDLVIAVIVGNLVDERERTAAYRHLESSLVQDWISQQLEGR